MTPGNPPTDGRIEKHVLIKAAPAIIFNALTDARDLVRWFCDRATSDPRIGGELTAFWRDHKSGQRGRAVFTHLEPNAFVGLRWLEEGEGPGRADYTHTLFYTIRARRRDTEVVMQDQDTPYQESDFLAILDEGWNTVLLALKEFCERKERSGKNRPQTHA
jgi:uncharacterized protein YndB with AHSA1/START domain